ncbi:C-type lectin-like isoform X2 [Hemicordylus capensis]|uniref:C-type lectin-like isoform X2 n=1 Tax=Hemicordylus capensis TaxID=884348 RepID=UPI0023042C7D|nr:C-type lectin-like isoform X2 [Hemicordylus capensis]
MLKAPVLNTVIPLRKCKKNICCAGCMMLKASGRIPPETPPVVVLMAICQQNRNGGHLASIASETLVQRIGGYLSQVNLETDFVWIGLQRTSTANMQRGWRWTDGTPFRYSNWLGGTPNNIGGKQYCVVLTPGSGYKSWDDATCSIVRPFLCKWRAS